MINIGMQHMVRNEGGEIEKEAEEIPLIARAAVNVSVRTGYGAGS